MQYKKSWMFKGSEMAKSRIRNLESFDDDYWLGQGFHLIVQICLVSSMILVQPHAPLRLPYSSPHSLHMDICILLLILFS